MFHFLTIISSDPLREGFTSHANPLHWTRKICFGAYGCERVGLLPQKGQANNVTEANAGGVGVLTMRCKKSAWADSV